MKFKGVAATFRLGVLFVSVHYKRRLKPAATKMHL
jgi:hypothetical protein